MTTTTPEVLADLVVAALLGKTVAAAAVHPCRDWPTKLDDLPMIVLDMPSEAKTSLGNAGYPSFNSVATIPIHGRVTAKAGAGDAGANAVRAALAILKRQIEVAVINDPAIMKLIQQFPFVRSRMGVSSEGAQHVGEVIVEVGMEYFQGDEDFAQPEVSDLEALQVYADLLNVFDPSKTYPDPPFPDAVTPAPRTSGPDGRAEGFAFIDLTT